MENKWKVVLSYRDNLQRAVKCIKERKLASGVCVLLHKAERLPEDIKARRNEAPKDDET